MGNPHPMLIRVARDLASSDCGSWDDLPLWVQIRYEERARVAVRAMLEPTDDMLEIGMDYDEREFEIATGKPPTPSQCVWSQYRAMLIPVIQEVEA